MRSEVYDQSICVVIRVARMYYFDGLSQKEIAGDLNISVSTVSRLIHRAKEEGIITFDMPRVYQDCIGLERQLLERYGLEEVIVVPPDPDREESELEIKKRVAREGARYVQRIITPKDILGIAWGGTMYELIQYLNPCRRTEAIFVTLHGSITSCNSKFEVDTLVRRIAMAFGGKHYAIAHPGLLPDQASRDALLREPEVQEVFDLYQRVTVSVSGIGSFYPEFTSPLSQLSYLTEEELNGLSEYTPYGDILTRFIDEKGQECPSQLSERTLAIDMDTYRRIPRKVLAASGAHKIYTVHAALQGGLVDVLIVDNTLARLLTELSG